MLLMHVYAHLQGSFENGAITIHVWLRAHVDRHQLDVKGFFFVEGENSARLDLEKSHVVQSGEWLAALACFNPSMLKFDISLYL